MKATIERLLLILTCSFVLLACNPNSKGGNEVHNAESDVIVDSTQHQLEEMAASAEYTPELEIIDVESNVNNYSDNLQLSAIATEVQYIPLKMEGENLMDKIRYIDIDEHYILIKAMNGIFLFNREGEFLNKIGAIGHGPFEYIFSGTPKISNDSVYVPIILPESQICIYDVNGSPITSIPTTPYCFSVREDNWYFSSPNFLIQVLNESGKEKNKIIAVNQEGEIVSTYENTTFFNGPEKARLGTLRTSNQFYSFNNAIYYKEILNDTLWQLHNSVLEPKYVFKRGKYGLSQNFQELSREEFTEMRKNEIAILRIIESKNFILFTTALLRNYPFDFYRTINDYSGEHRMPYHVLGYYNKKTKEINFIKPTNPGQQIEPMGIPNDFDCGINLFPKNTTNHGEFFSWFEAYELKSYVSTECFKNSTPKYPKKKRELKKLAKRLTIYDNPVVMIVKLKE